MSDESKDAVERRTEQAFERTGWQDPRAHYRALLRRLKQSETTRYDAAVQAYRSSVEARLQDVNADPVAAWLEYGRRLAELMAGGRAVRIDRDGVAAADEPGTEPTLLLQLPADESAPAIVIALPREPSPAQRATVVLLVDGRQNLPA